MAATFLEMLQQGQTSKKTSILLNGRKTSIRLEPAFLDELSSIARERGISRNGLISQLHEYKPYLETENLASLLRLFVLSEFQRKAGGMS